MYLNLLRTHITKGILHLHLPDGSIHTFGKLGREAHWYIHREKAMWRIARNWDMALGETYMDGDWDVGEYDMQDLLVVLRENFSTSSNLHWYTPVLRLLRLINNIARN